MKIQLSAFAVLVAFLSPALGEVKLENIKARYGNFGPERTTLKIVPGDEVFLTFMITGVKANAAGQVDGELAQKVINADGQIILDNKSPIKSILALGGDSLPAKVTLSLSPKTPPGDYTVQVSFTDKISGQTANFERVVTCLKPGFAIVRPQLGYDQEMKTSAVASVPPGQVLFFRLGAIGFDRSQKKFDLLLHVQALDADGKEAMPNLIKVEAVNDNEEVVAKQEVLVFTGFFYANRTGNFKVRFTVTDRITKKSAIWELPLKVSE